MTGGLQLSDQREDELPTVVVVRDGIDDLLALEVEVSYVWPRGVLWFLATLDPDSLGDILERGRDSPPIRACEDRIADGIEIDQGRLDMQPVLISHGLFFLQQEVEAQEVALRVSIHRLR